MSGSEDESSSGRVCATLHAASPPWRLGIHDGQLQTNPVEPSEGFIQRTHADWNCSDYTEDSQNVSGRWCSCLSDTPVCLSHTVPVARSVSWHSVSWVADSGQFPLVRTPILVHSPDAVSRQRKTTPLGYRESKSTRWDGGGAAIPAAPNEAGRCYHPCGKQVLLVVVVIRLSATTCLPNPSRRK